MWHLWIFEGWPLIYKTKKVSNAEESKLNISVDSMGPEGQEFVASALMLCSHLGSPSSWHG